MKQKPFQPREKNHYFLVALIQQLCHTGCIKKCPEYKIASKLNICKITDTTSN